MKESQSLKYFQAAFAQWFKKSKLRQYQAAMLLEVSQSLVTQFLRGKTGLSFAQADDIATKLKTTVIDMLQEGKKILEPNQADVKDNLTEEQRMALAAFEECLLAGGEGAELLTEQAIRLAQKKRNESEDPTIMQGLKSAS